MRKFYTTAALVCLTAAACGTPQPATGDHKAWGEETPNGPRVSGRNLGMITVDGRTGTGYDINGDGRADEIDLDGDGVSDGEDVDNDGTISLWNQFSPGYTPDPTPQDDLPATDPDDFRRLDPSASVSNMAADGTVMEPMQFALASNGAPMGMGNGMTMNSNGELLRAINQGQQGSCNAFANAGLVTLLRYYRERAQNPMVDPNTLWASPSYIYTRVLNGSPCNQGTAIVNALNLFARAGSASLAEQPYRSGGMPMLCEPTDPDVAMAPHQYRIGSWQRFSERGMALRARIRESIAAGVPVPFGVNLPEGFMEFRETTAGVNVREPFTGTGMCMGSGHCGGHAMLITGYDDSKSAYRVLNSWGNDWGDGGYLWWGYESLEAGTNLDAYQVIPLPGAPTPLPATPPMITMTQPMGTQPVLRLVTRQLQGGPQMRWTLFVRVQFNDPVNLTRVTATVDNNGQALTLSSTMSYGDIGFLLPGDAMPAAGSMAELEVAGKDRAGADFMQTLTVMIPAPSMN